MSKKEKSRKSTLAGRGNDEAESHQAPSAQQWNPPKPRAKDIEAADESFHKREVVASATDCTGLMMQVPGTEAAAESLSDLYAIHEVKPQGNVGKDNPNNDPDEIAFHRSDADGGEG